MTNVDQIINSSKEEDRKYMKMLGITSRKAYIKLKKKWRRTERIKNAECKVQKTSN